MQWQEGGVQKLDDVVISDNYKRKFTESRKQKIFDYESKN